MKRLILIASLFIASAAFADEVQKLTSTNEVYSATVKTSGVVFYNIVGKSSMTRTNLAGWNILKTNLMSRGYVLIVNKVKTYTQPVATRVDQNSQWIREEAIAKARSAVGYVAYTTPMPSVNVSDDYDAEYEYYRHKYSDAPSMDDLDKMFDHLGKAADAIGTGNHGLVQSHLDSAKMYGKW